MKFGKRMMAPCGIHCSFCYVHHRDKKTCDGCRSDKGFTPVSCSKCKIKHCVHEKSLTYCSECKKYPCQLIKRLDKSYQLRYGESIIDNLKKVDEMGLEAFIEYDKKRLTCKACGGYLNVHEKKCHQCNQVY